MVCFHTQYSVRRPGLAHPLTDEMAFLELVFPVPTAEVCLTLAGAIFSWCLGPKNRVFCMRMEEQWHDGGIG